MFVATIEALALLFPNLSTALIQNEPVAAFTTRELDFLLTTFARGVLSFQVAPVVTF